MVIELRVVQFWSEIILVISNRTRAARSSDFKITHMISDQIALHSVQLPLFIALEKCEKECNMLGIILVQGFCPLTIKITQFPDGFCLNTITVQLLYQRLFTSFYQGSTS